MPGCRTALNFPLFSNSSLSTPNPLSDNIVMALRVDNTTKKTHGNPLDVLRREIHWHHHWIMAVVLTLATGFSLIAAEADPATDATSKDRELRKAQLDEALALCHAFPANDNAAYLLGLVYEMQGNAQKAIETWKACLTLDAKRADLHDSLGYRLFLTGQIEAGERHLKQALALNPKRYEARLHLAELYRDNGHFEAMTAVLDKVEKHTDAGFLLLGQAYRQTDDLVKARECFEKAIALNDKMVKAYYGLIRIYARLKNTERLNACRARFKELSGKFQKEGRNTRRQYDALDITRKSVAHTHTDLARVYLSEGKIGKAEALLLRSVALDPGNISALFHLAELYNKTRRPHKAQPYYRALTEKQPDNGLYFYYLGHNYVQTQKFREAERAFGRTLKLAPRRPEGYTALANLHLLTGRHPERALILSRKAVALDPTGITYYILSRACEANGLIPEAVIAIKAALDKEPNRAAFRRQYEKLSARQ